MGSQQQSPGKGQSSGPAGAGGGAGGGGGGSAAVGAASLASPDIFIVAVKNRICEYMGCNNNNINLHMLICFLADALHYPLDLSANI